MKTKACDGERSLLYRSEFVVKRSGNNGLVTSLRARIRRNGLRSYIYAMSVTPRLWENNTRY